jgi:hypothetical protein
VSRKGTIAAAICVAGTITATIAPSAEAAAPQEFSITEHLAALGAPTAHAAPPVPFTINEMVDFDGVNTFTATDPLCPSGTFTDQPLVSAGNFDASGVFVAVIETTYVCADGSGTFYATKQARFTAEEGVVGRITLHGGTGEYVNLRGQGTNTGQLDFEAGTGTGQAKGVIVGPR